MTDTKQQDIQLEMNKIHDSKQVIIGEKKSKFNPIDIVFKNINYSVDIQIGKQVQTRQILDDVSGICKSGECTAILGSSGAGKTSLLNILAKRIEKTKKVKLEGQVVANDLDYTFDQFPNFATYVMQDDRLFESMTVSEVLQFACNLKMKAPQSEKTQKLNEVIKQMRLERARNTFIGGQFVKGISGGERKRVSIGFELICSPRVVMLDEPTSGLDSFTAYLLILSLKKYAQLGNTVIFTIHQPSSDIWEMFDRVVLLVKGKLIYQGPGRQTILDYFSRLNYNCSLSSNPADYFMSLMQLTDEESELRNKNFHDEYERSLKQEIGKQIEERCRLEIEQKIVDNSFFYCQQQVMKRTVMNILRNPVLFVGRIFQDIFLALFVGAIYYQLPRNYEVVQDMVGLMNKAGFLFFQSIGMFMESCMPNVLTFPLERGVFLKEYNMRMYSLPAYFMGKNLPEFPINFFMPMISSVIVYWMVGLNNDAESFFKYYFICCLLSLCGSSIGIMIGALFSSTKLSSEAAPVMIVPFMLFGGFYSNSDSIRPWIKWLENVSPFKFGFEGFAHTEFAPAIVTPDPIDQFGLKLNYGLSVLLLIVLFVCYRLLALFFLWKNTKKLQ